MEACGAVEEISQYAMKGINKAWTGETKSPDVDFHFRFVCSGVAGVDFLLGSSLQSLVSSVIPS